MTERLRYVPVQTKEDLKKENVKGVGCVLLLFNKEGNVYTVIEREKQGINVVTETRKSGEFIGQNIIGALTEEVGIKPEDFGNIYWVRGLSNLGRVGFSKKGNIVHADVVALFYSGNEKVFSSRNEVSGIGFHNLDELIQRTDLRQAVLPALQFTQEQNFPVIFLEAISQGKGEVFMQMMRTMNLIPESYVEQRQALSDLLL